MSTCRLLLEYLLCRTMLQPVADSHSLIKAPFSLSVSSLNPISPHFWRPPVSVWTVTVKTISCRCSSPTLSQADFILFLLFCLKVTQTGSSLALMPRFKQQSKTNTPSAHLTHRLFHFFSSVMCRCTYWPLILLFVMYKFYIVHLVRRSQFALIIK